MKGITAARPIVKVIEDEAKRNPKFAQRMQAAQDEAAKKIARRRRPPPALNVESVVKNEGKDALRERLSQLDLEQLHDIVSHEGMGQYAARWKNRERVISRIVELAHSRAHKGEAFLNWTPSERRMA